MTDDPNRPSGHPEDFEAILFQYVDRLNAGEILDPELVEREHPDCAALLLERLDLYRELVEVPGELLGTIGDYTLRRQIGRGGMGVVYEAWESSMGRRVALKVLPSGIAADQKTFLRFMREAKTAGQLSHPNVVSVYALGVKDQTPYYAMELVDGETLAEVVATMRAAGPGSRTPVGPTRDDIGFYSAVALVFAEAADGLQHAHSKGVVHRDIKPSNLILDAGISSKECRGNEAGGTHACAGAEGSARCSLRILDFGLARLEGQESLSETGGVVGTPLYMSPEQARRTKVPVDYRTDVYSLGATLYEVLTLEPPFRGKDHEDTLSQIVARAPRPPRQLNARVPRDLETIVLKCLRKDPGDRYATAEALGQDLRRFARGDPIEARPVARIERWIGIARRGRKRALLALLGGCLLVSVAVVTRAWVLAPPRPEVLTFTLPLAELPMVDGVGQIDLPLPVPVPLVSVTAIVAQDLIAELRRDSMFREERFEPEIHVMADGQATARICCGPWIVERRDSFEEARYSHAVPILGHLGDAGSVASSIRLVLRATTEGRPSENGYVLLGAERRDALRIHFVRGTFAPSGRHQVRVGHVIVLQAANGTASALQPLDRPVPADGLRLVACADFGMAGHADLSGFVFQLRLVLDDGRELCPFGGESGSVDEDLCGACITRDALFIDDAVRRTLKGREIRALRGVLRAKGPAWKHWYPSATYFFYEDE